MHASLGDSCALVSGIANCAVFYRQMMRRAGDGVNVRKWEVEERSGAGLYQKNEEEIGKTDTYCGHGAVAWDYESRP